MDNQLESVCRKLATLEQIIERMLANSVTANGHRLVEKKLDQMEAYTVTLADDGDHRHLAAEWRDRLAMLWFRFGDLDEPLQNNNNNHQQQNEDKKDCEILDAAGDSDDLVQHDKEDSLVMHRIETIKSIVRALFESINHRQLEMNSDLVSDLRKRLEKIEHLICQLSINHVDIAKYRLEISNMWTLFYTICTVDDYDDREEEDGDQPNLDVDDSNSNYYEEDEDQKGEDQDSGLDDDQSRDGVKRALLSEISIQLKRCPQVPEFEMPPPPLAASTPDANKVSNRSSNNYELTHLCDQLWNAQQLLEEFKVSTDLELQDQLLTVALRKVPPKDRAEFVRLNPRPSTPLRSLYNFITNLNQLRTDFWYSGNSSPSSFSAASNDNFSVGSLIQDLQLKKEANNSSNF